MYLETQGHFSWLSFLHPVALTIFWISFYLPSSLPGAEREVVLLHRCVSAAPQHTVRAGGSSGGRQGPQPHPAVAQTPQRLLQQGGSEPLLQQPPHLLAGVNRSHKVCIYVYIFIRKLTTRLSVSDSSPLTYYSVPFFPSAPVKSQTRVRPCWMPLRGWTMTSPWRLRWEQSADLMEHSVAGSLKSILWYFGREMFSRKKKKKSLWNFSSPG